MGTIIDYLKEYGDYTFTEKPMNEVDSLVLCQFSYLKFDGIVPFISQEKPFVTIEYLENHQDSDKLFADERYRESNKALFSGMLNSVRFQTLKMNYYVNIIEPEKETQFSAITFLLEDKTVYIAYRGTDETIVGWKEDFNLAFSEPVAGQIYSVEYINQISRKFAKEFYIGGHSKGGNFAIYAAMNCRAEVRERIVNIFSHDGPGFRPEIREKGNYAKIADKVIKIVPHSSMVGMILGSVEDNYMVVESKTFGLLQHDPYTWLVKDDKFVQVKDIYKRRRFLDEALNTWILSLDQEHIRSFVDTLYEVVSASKAVTLIDFTADWKKNMTAVIAAIKDLDVQTADMMKKIITSLFDITKERAKEELQVRSEENKKKSEKRRRKRKKPQIPADSNEDIK